MYASSIGDFINCEFCIVLSWYVFVITHTILL
jgi:hypothetical protein